MGLPFVPYLLKEAGQPSDAGAYAASTQAALAVGFDPLGITLPEAMSLVVTLISISVRLRRGSCQVPGPSPNLTIELVALQQRSAI